MTHLTDPKMKECVEACNQCYQMCLHEAMNHCLEKGGEHVAPDHFRLMMSCAEICKTSVNFMLIRSPFCHQHCRVCADVCEACASSCEKLSMDDCARVCRECAKSCRAMAA